MKKMRKPVRFRTWEDIDSLDDCILPSERKLILEIEKERAGNEKCPCLRKDGIFFYYCSPGLPGETSDKPRPDNPMYQSHVSMAELQLYCMGDYGKCTIYLGNAKQNYE